MDQKNTIVKCAMHQCLFNHCGTCDQYVITIGVNGSCQAYVETEIVDMHNLDLGEPVLFKMKIAELNKPNKNKSTIREIGHASPKGYFGVDDFL